MFFFFWSLVCFSVFFVTVVAGVGYVGCGGGIYASFCFACLLLFCYWLSVFET